MTFNKKHPYLTILFFVCVVLMIKNSSIPYIIAVPKWVKLIFDKPSNSFFFSLSQLVDVFSSAYVTSLLFYWLVDYLPSERKEKIVLKIIEPQLVNLYLYMNELTEMIRFYATYEKILPSNNISDLDNLQIRDITIPCNKQTLINSESKGTCAYSFNVLKDFHLYKTLVINCCNKISSTPSFSLCEIQLINTISEIQLSELLRIIPDPNNFFTHLNFVDIQYMGLGKGYEDFKEFINKLEPYVSTKLKYKMSKMTDVELSDWQKHIADSIKEKPEILEILLAAQSHDS